MLAKSELWEPSSLAFAVPCVLQNSQRLFLPLLPETIPMPFTITWLFRCFPVQKNYLKNMSFSSLNFNNICAIPSHVAYSKNLPQQTRLCCAFDIDVSTNNAWFLPSFSYHFLLHFYFDSSNLFNILGILANTDSQENCDLYVLCIVSYKLYLYLKPVYIR